MKPWLEDNSTEINLTDNKGKSVVAEKCIRTLKDTIYKYMTYKYMTYNTWQYIHQKMCILIN